jgi:hypothetical protein
MAAEGYYGVRILTSTTLRREVATLLMRMGEKEGRTLGRLTGYAMAGFVGRELENS